MTMTPAQLERWASEVARDCLLEAGGDADLALAAAEYILSTQPVPAKFSIETDGGKADEETSTALLYGVSEGASSSTSSSLDTAREGKKTKAGNARAKRGKRAKKGKKELPKRRRAKKKWKTTPALSVALSADEANDWAETKTKDHLGRPGWYSKQLQQVLYQHIKPGTRPPARPEPTAQPRPQAATAAPAPRQPAQPAQAAVPQRAAAPATPPPPQTPQQAPTQAAPRSPQQAVQQTTQQTAPQTPQQRQGITVGAKGSVIQLVHTTNADLPGGVPTKADQAGLVWYFKEGGEYGAYGKNSYTLNVPGSEILDMNKDANVAAYLKVSGSLPSRPSGRSKQGEMEFAESLGYKGVMRGSEIAMRPQTAETWKKAEQQVQQTPHGVTSNANTQRSVGPGGGQPPQIPATAGAGVAGAPPAPSSPQVGGGGQDTNKPVGTGVVKNRAATRAALLNDIVRYGKVLWAKGHKIPANWLHRFGKEVQRLGPDNLESKLLPEPTNGGSPHERVQYEGAYDEMGSKPEHHQFIKDYLARTGISIVTSQDTFDPKIPLVSSFSKKQLESLGREGRDKPGNYIPADPTFKDKLEEAKHLPGLETTEDIHKVAGEKVTNLTPQVTAKFDAKYGKGGWLVKSYGDEAYAGFGVLFPQRIQEIQQFARKNINDAKVELAKVGYRLSRGKDGKINGIYGRNQDLDRLDKMIYFDTPEFEKLDDKTKQLGKKVQLASHSEGGMGLPKSHDDLLLANYGSTLKHDANGVPTGIKYFNGRDYDLGSKDYERLVELNGESFDRDVKKALEADDWRRKGHNPDPKFMVQPAWEAVGVSDADRASGVTWESGREGRVHIITNGGKVQAIPYASTDSRGSDMPVVFHSQDTIDMIRAGEEAVRARPEADRQGQLYGLDVVKTPNGWKAVETNPSTVGGGSDWYGESPMVIDALVSHLMGREPAHVKFIRKLLAKHGITKHPTDVLTKQTASQTPQSKGTQALSVDDQPRVPAGTPEGGQWSKRGIRTIKHGKLAVMYTVHRSKSIAGPKLALKNYRQQDYHSCGFVAAMTVAKYFAPGTRPKDVLKSVKPTKSSGIDADGMVAALRDLGVEATYTGDLTIDKLREHVDQGTPVLVTVLPKDWTSDHWTVVQGFDGDRIYLTNHRSMSTKKFQHEWFDQGEGLVCRPTTSSKE